MSWIRSFTAISVRVPSTLVDNLRHLLVLSMTEKTDGLNLFFSFRCDPHLVSRAFLLCSSSWVLIAFKREFPFDDVLRLWEVFWTDYYSNNFVLFVALAVLESHRDMIIRYLLEVSDRCVPLIYLTRLFSV